jgi:hypothetical protein
MLANVLAEHSTISKIEQKREPACDATPLSDVVADANLGIDGRLQSGVPGM